MSLAGLDLSDGVSIVGVYDRAGAGLVPARVTCVNGYANVNRNMCVPCGNGMVYDTGIKLCVCSGANLYPVNGFCLAGTFTNP